MAEQHTIYMIEQFQFDRLRTIEKAIYGDGSHITPDRRRDIANSLNVLLDEIQKYGKVQHARPINFKPGD